MKGWDYATPGYYFVTICTKGMRDFFGTIVNGRMVLNDAGRMVARVWEGLPQFYGGIGAEEYVVMPNHFHGIVRIGQARRPARTEDAAGAGLRACPMPALPDVVRNFKSYTTSQYFKFHAPANVADKLWHRNYWDVIVRDSGFLSPMERQVFRAGLAHKKPLIWIKPWALEEGADQPAIREAIEQGRLLILSPFDETIEAPSARRAVWCNQYVVKHCDRMVVGRLNPTGLLACILSEVDPDKEIVYLHAIDL